MYNEAAQRLDDHYERRVLDGLPEFDYGAAGIGPTSIVEARSAWPSLEQLHAVLAEQCDSLAAKRGSAEWLWWLRRLRGQFHLNRFDTTDPYVQVLAETLAAGASRPSVPAESDTYEYRLDPEVLLDLLWLRNFAIATYRLHGTMKRCAKGQDVRFVDGDVPEAVMSEPLEHAILEYDLRVERSGGSLLDAVGLHAATSVEVQDLPSGGFGGLVPFWSALTTQRSDRIVDEADPAPCIVRLLDLNAIEPFVRTPILQREHLALIAMLHAAWNIITREPEHRRRRGQAAFQWGYMVTPTTNFLRLALDESLGWMRDHPDPVVPVGNVPADSDEVFAIMSQLQPSILPPYCGNPLHEAGPHTHIDLTGASHRLWETLVRPVDGAGANFWSQEFERDVQRLVDKSPWRPDGPLRDLIGQTIRRSDGTALTDLDAVGVSGNELLLLSCKSVAIGPGHLGGGHASVRNFREKSEEAARQWRLVVEELQADPGLLGSALDAGVSVHGLVVCPAVPFVVTSDLRSPTQPLGTPYVLSSSELEDALRSAGRPT